MTILDIKLYPDPVLKEETTPVSEFTPALGVLIDNMFETMYHADGIGLAAPQVGSLHRIAVIDVSRDGKEPREFVNPRIVESVGTVSSEEGCLSIPDFRETIERFEKVIVEACDRSGKEFRVEADGLLAICLQHEIDHLEGILFIDKLSRLKREYFKKWLQKREQR